MPFELLQKPAFINDLISLPRSTQKKVSKALERIVSDPFQGGGLARPCFKHLYKNVYRYRIGDDRIVYAVGKNVITILAIGKREDIYRKFSGDPDEVQSFAGDITTAEPKLFVTAPYDEENLPQSKGGGDSIFEPVTTSYEAEVNQQDQLLNELLEQWKVPAIYHPTIIDCQSWDDLLDLDIPDQVKEKILHFIFPPTLEQIHEQPNLELSTPKDIDRFLDGSLKKFLLKLDPEQERVASSALRGPTLVKGGPGTGKSLVALYRIRNLLTPDVQQSLFGAQIPSILFVTYSTSLVEASKQLLEELLGDKARNVTVTNLDKIVKAIIEEAGYDFRPATANQQLEALREVSGIQQLANIREGYLIDEFDWVIEGRNLLTLEEYLSEDRRGRGIPLDRQLRTTIWGFYEEYVKRLAENGLSSWNRYRSQAAELLGNDATLQAKYDVVIVDEAQDLTPAGLSLCVELCKDPQGLYLTADANQSIYNRGFSWNRVHAALQFRGRATILRRNYRSTREIGSAALQVLAASSEGDFESLQSNPVNTGPRPILVRAESTEGQYKAAVQFLKKAAEELRMPVWNGAVLAPSNRVAEEVAEYFCKVGIKAKAVKGWQLKLDERVVKVMTIHSAKGLEFPMVAVVRLDDNLLPGLWYVTDPDEEKARVEEQRKLLFVAFSRAMRRLAAICSQANASRFIDEFNPMLWDVREVRD